MNIKKISRIVLCAVLFAFFSVPVFADVILDAVVSVSATVEETGGGGGGSITPYVKFSGYAYPGATVYIESDSKNIGILNANSDGLFSYNIYNITSGIHDFSIYAKDIKGNFSNSVSFLVDVPVESITNIFNVFIPPTVVVDKLQYGVGEKIKISGYAMPGVPIYVEIKSSGGVFKTFSKKIFSGGDGYFEYIPTSDLFGYGLFSVSVKSLYGGFSSSFGTSFDFQIMKKISLSATSSRCGQKVDLNKDCKVNIIDFFIEFRWYKKTLTEVQKKRFDFNNDGRVDISDFSIMAFYWTRE
ncbi:dockerin type I domain-containing protein [Candidatus Gracilibacteria bacterium]|nr:dockerin type I domain-containing protein [Candidatus Gracilibacteria bacterium]